MTSLVFMELECGHVVLGRPHSPWWSICRLCNNRMPLKDIIVREWRNRCYDCSHTVWTGMDEHRARRNCIVHNSHRPNHRMFAELAVRPSAKKIRDLLLKNGVIQIGV